MDFSVSLEGYARALAEMDLAARKIAAPTPTASSGDSYEPGQSAPTAIDYAGELVTIRREKVAARASLKVLELQTDLADETLRLLGTD